MDDPQMRMEKTVLNRLKLARPLRVGLVGSPYFWSGIDFAAWKSNGVELGLIAFVGNSEANLQDLLLVADETQTSPNKITQLPLSEFLVPELSISQPDLTWLHPDTLIDTHTQAIDGISDDVHEQLKQHGGSYVGAEKVIAKYGTEIIRVASLLGKPQLHIQNEALQYLINSPWRNGRELEFAIARMAFYSTDDVLRETYVIDKVYDFSTSIRGVSNSQGSKPLVNKFVWDVANSKCVKTAVDLLQTKIEGISIGKQTEVMPKTGTLPARKNAA